jgi:hypothetical protein
MQSLQVGLAADTDQIPESDAEVACVAGFAVVVDASASDGHCRCDVGASVHVAFQGSVDTVAGVGKMVVPGGPAGRWVQKTRRAAAQSREVGRACCRAARVGPFLEVIVGIEGEVVDSL